MRILYVNEKVYTVVIIARQAEIIPAVAESYFGVLKREGVALPDETRGSIRDLWRYRASSQSRTAAEVGTGATGGTTLNATVHEIQVEPK